MANLRRIRRVLKTREEVWRRRAEGWAEELDEAAEEQRAQVEARPPLTPGAAALWSRSEGTRAERLAAAEARAERAAAGVKAAREGLRRAVTRTRAAERALERRRRDLAQEMERSEVADLEAWQTAKAAGAVTGGRRKRGRRAEGREAGRRGETT